MDEISIKDVYEATLRLAGKAETHERRHLTIVPQPRPEVESVTDLADTYARMTSELIAMVDAEAERSAHHYAVLSSSLKELENALRAFVEAAT